MDPNEKMFVPTTSTTLYGTVVARNESFSMSSALVGVGVKRTTLDVAVQGYFWFIRETLLV